MATINIPESNAEAYKNFVAGQSVKLDAVSLHNKSEFRQGQEVTISHLNMEGVGKIVSPPLLKDKSDEKKVFTVVVQKCD